MPQHTLVINIDRGTAHMLQKSNYSGLHKI